MQTQKPSEQTTATATKKNRTPEQKAQDAAQPRTWALWAAPLPALLDDAAANHAADAGTTEEAAREAILAGLFADEIAARSAHEGTTTHEAALRIMEERAARRRAATRKA